MNTQSQIEALLSMFAAQLPTLVACVIALAVVVVRWKAAGNAAIWALLGFGLALILCAVIPVAQTAMQQWLIRKSTPIAEMRTTLAALGFGWSILRALTYALLLIAVFAGRSTSSPSSAR